MLSGAEAENSGKIANNGHLEIRKVGKNNLLTCFFEILKGQRRDKRSANFWFHFQNCCLLFSLLALKFTWRGATFKFGGFLNECDSRNILLTYREIKLHEASPKILRFGAELEI